MKEQKKTFREYYQTERAIYKNPNRLKCFFSALDSVLEGNKLYDWYWWHIWSNVWNFCYTKPLERRQQRKYDKQRIRYGVSEKDCWSIPDWLRETMYYALKNFLKGEYGKEPIDWKERQCSTHGKRLYNAITKYLKEYERLTYLQDRVSKFDSGNQPTEEWYPEYKALNDEEYKQELYVNKLLASLLSKYMEVLWW